MSNNIDIKTLEAFQDGNHKAFETVFIAYYNKTKAFIDGYIKSESDAEELTEDLFVNLWINHDSIDASKSFSSYLHTIARNSAINFLKHKYVHDTYLISGGCQPQKRSRQQVGDHHQYNIQSVSNIGNTKEMRKQP